MNISQAQVKRASASFYNGTQPALSGERRPMGPFTGPENISYHDQHIDRILPQADNAQLYTGERDEDPAIGVIQTSGRRHQHLYLYEGTSSQGRYQEVVDFGGGALSHSTTVITDKAVQSLEITRTDEGASADFQYLDRQNPEKSYTQPVDIGWLVSQ